MPPSENISRVYTSRRETRAFYDRISGFYDALSARSEAPVRAAAVEMLQPAEGEWILEVGSGTGHGLAAFGSRAGSGGRVVAVDLSERMIERARALASAYPVDFVCGDGLCLPIRSGTFDAVFMAFTLELFDTPEIPGVLGECRRVLKPGGRAAFAAVSKDGPGSVKLRTYEWMHRHLPAVVDCRPIFLGRAVESAGFRVAQRRIAEMWVPVEIVLARP
ncbi:MAG: class I SAM-dependent methyltransferase [Acidobacteria bacterium]|nr:class I SAM-dependent methyltransferase [Acidobacteriota bacterium]